MKLYQRPYRQVPKTKGTGDWYKLHHGLVTNRKFGKAEHGPEYFLEHSAILCALDASIRQKNSKITTMELGAGWGQKTLDMVAYCRKQGVGIMPYVVEADGTHYTWLLRTLAANNVLAVPVYGAVSGTFGWADFCNEGDVYTKHAWAQHLARSSEIGNMSVPVFTLAWVFETFNISKIDVLHMDVQGSETNVITGAVNYLHKIDTFIFGIHAGDHITEIPQLFQKYSPEHKVVLALPKHSGVHTLPGFDNPVDIRSDGILILSKV